VVGEALADARRPTALFCLSDSIAHGAYAAVRSAGLAIPRDVSVMGYDDQPVSALLTPALTTFGWDTEALVAAAAGFVVAAVDGSGRRHRLVVAPRLLVRESTGQPPRHRRPPGP
jgi:LacI family transcriptional regulator